MTKSWKNIRLTGLGFLLAIMVSVLATGAGVHAASYSESSYSRVYNYKYYTVKNKSKLSAAVRNSPKKALAHFVEHGMAQGLQAKSTFNLKVYMKNYPDLVKKYGNNYKKYYIHFQNTGYKHRYGSRDVTTMTFELIVNPNGGTYKGSSKAVRIRKKFGTKITLATPKRSGYDFAGWKQYKGYGTLKGSRFIFDMRKNVKNIVKASWSKKVTGRYSLAGRIADVALTQLGNGGTPYWNYFNDVFDNHASNYEWCCMFVTYCANKAGFISRSAAYGTFGSGHFPRTASQRELAKAFAKRGQLKLRTSGYKPQKGDIIFFTKNTSNFSDYESYSHVGIVTGRSRNNVITVEGNTGTYDRYTSYVKKCIYNPVDAGSSYHTSKALRIAAYGIIK